MAKTIRISPQELILRDEEMPFTFDGTLCTLTQGDGRLRVWETDLGTRPFYFIFEGTKENPLENRVGTFTWDYNGYSDRWPDGLWVQSFYQVKPEDCDHPSAQKGDFLIGFIHREQFSNPFREDGSLDHGHGDCNSYHIGLGYSLDRGLSWFYCGDIVSNVQNNKKRLANMGGVPFFRIGDDFQFYFNEYPSDGEAEKLGLGHYLSCARIGVKETVRALLQKKLPHAYKYSGDGVWDTDGMTGTGMPVLPSPYQGFDAHADACYNSALGKYLLTAWFHSPARLCLFASADGEHWEEPMTLYREETDEIMNPYSTFAAITEDDASHDSSVVGREFYIYYPRKGRQNYGFDEFYRQKLVITDEI